MFRKIVTELAYSPALAGKLGEYIRSIRQEKSKRELGLIFIALTLVIQVFIYSFPPESANSGNPAVFVDGGIASIDNYLSAYYDQNIEGSKDFLNSLGIARSNIQSAQLTTITPSSNLLFWSTKSHGDGSDTSYTFFSTDNLKGQNVYYRSLESTNLPSNANNLVAYVGSSPSIGWFALLKDSGNLVTRHLKQLECSSDQPYTDTMPIATLDCFPTLTPKLFVQNLSTNTSSIKAVKASDRVLYRLSLRNEGTTEVAVPLSIELGDILEYGQLLDKGGGTLVDETKALTWGEVTVPPNTELTRNFIVQLLPVIPSSPQGRYNTASYDCTISASFGTIIHMPVTCPFPKSVEHIIRSLPPVNFGASLLLTTTAACLMAFLYARSRQYLTELHRIQHNHSGSL